jgi:hypothetical protein
MSKLTNYKEYINLPEYLELVAAAGDNAFTAGLLFPAIPLWIERGIGIDIVEGFIKQLVE